jgi:exopolysaccharide biosynthesis protein
VHQKKKEHKIKKRVWIPILAVVLLAGMYLTAVYSSIPFIAKWRTIYIETAMSTYTHQWLATKFIPGSVIDKVMAEMEEQTAEQEGLVSTWGDDDDFNLYIDIDGQEELVDPEAPTITEEPKDPEKVAFYETWWELDEDDFEKFLAKNPKFFTDGYDGITIDNLDGTYDLKTNMDENICVIDVPNNILIVEATGDGFAGKLAVVKNPEQVTLAKSSSLGSYGNVLRQMATNYGAVLAINASGFGDPNWEGNGGYVIGSLVIDGKDYGHPDWTLKLFGFKSDNRLYIENYSADAVKEYKWAIQFSPALIVDGKQYVEGTYGYGLQPRTSIGQTKDGEVLLLVIDGRQVGHSLGCTVTDLAEIMLRHKAYQAMNVDGGSSALMWYNGIEITSPSSTTSLGRYLPDAIIVMPGNTVSDD